MGNSIKELREKRGLTQAQLAELVGTTQPQITRLEKSTRKLSEDWLIKLSQALDCSPTEILGIPSEQLDPQEEAMLGLFRGLTPEQREAFLKLANTMAKPSSDSDEQSGTG